MPDESKPTAPNVDQRFRPRRAADVFDDWDREGRMERMAEGHLATAGRVLDGIDPPRGGVFLDVGCGVGAAAARVKRRRGDVTTVAFDMAPRLAARAARNPRIDHAFRADATRIPLREASVHAAFSMEVLYYLRHPTVALREIARVLAPDGTFDLMVDFYDENPHSADWPRMMDLHMTRWSKGQWSDAFRAAGFGDVTARNVLPDPDAARHKAYADPDHGDWSKKYGSLHVTGRRGAPPSKEPSGTP